MPREIMCPGRQCAPADDVPRRQFAPGDNMPRRQCAPEGNVPQKAMSKIENNGKVIVIHKMSEAHLPVEDLACSQLLLPSSVAALS